MRNYEPRNIVLNTIPSTGGNDLIVDGQLVWINKHYIGRYLDWQPHYTRKETPITTATQGVVTITPTVFTNDTTYSFLLTQNKNGTTGTETPLVQKVISIKTPAAGAITATTICNQFRTEASFAGFDVVLSGAATLIITASATSPLIFAGLYNAGGLIATDIVNTTPGVNTRGLAANLVSVGVPAADASTTLGYTLYSIRNNENTGSYTNTIKTNQPEEIYLWINLDSANAAALITDFDNLLANNGFDVIEIIT